MYTISPAISHLEAKDSHPFQNTIILWRLNLEWFLWIYLQLYTGIFDKKNQPKQRQKFFWRTCLHFNIYIDSPGFSDPYCMLGIMPGRLLDQDLSSAVLSDEEDHHRKEEKKRGGSLRKFSLTKKKKDKTVKELIPAKLIKTTDVKPNTVNPVWEEKFRL